MEYRLDNFNRYEGIVNLYIGFKFMPISKAVLLLNKDKQVSFVLTNCNL